MSAFIVVTWTCVGLTADLSVALAAPNGVHSAAAGMPISQVRSVGLIAEPSVSTSGSGASPMLAAECDPLGSPVRCFTPPANPLTGTYLNVASFFDLRRRSLSTHYFLKYFENAGSVAVEITGLGVYFDSNHPNLKVLPAAGVLRTSKANPALPLPVDLTNLQVVGIPIANKGVETCIQMSSAVRLEADEAAWLVVRFPAAPTNSFIGLLADVDATDEDCDYLTPDAGEMYFRPDPRNGPPFDWAITAYTRPVAGKERFAEKMWSEVKQLYRDPDIETAR